jgi:hypothetical protein
VDHAGPRTHDGGARALESTRFRRESPELLLMSGAKGDHSTSDPNG